MTFNLPELVEGFFCFIVPTFSFAKGNVLQSDEDFSQEVDLKETWVWFAGAALLWGGQFLDRPLAKGGNLAFESVVDSLSVPMFAGIFW